MEKESFGHKLIKGKIAETIFELMFRDTKKFMVFHFGYEFTAPTLAQYKNIGDLTMKKRALDQVDKSPDFILMTEDKKQVYFVEVKYRANFDKKDILETAREIHKRWELCYLFLITKNGFYFSSINTIISKQGVVSRLSTKWVSQGIQDKYSRLSLDFLAQYKD